MDPMIKLRSCAASSSSVVEMNNNKKKKKKKAKMLHEVAATSPLIMLLICFLLLLAPPHVAVAVASANNNVIFPVQSKFKGSGGGGGRSGERWWSSSLAHLRAHDARRHGRLLSSSSSSSVNLDLPLGGNGDPADTGLYFAKIRIGTPPKDHYVQVDTGSDILWVNCAGCDTCPTKTDIGVTLTQYDPNGSSTSSMVTCDQEFCQIAHNDAISGCKPKMSCQYKVEYGDGTIIAGYFVKDNLSLDQASGNLQTSPTNASVVFGCAAKQSGNNTSSAEALDGILGFGQANASLLSQLASTGKVKKMFAHCLDGQNGGGIFAIGDVVQPKINTTKLVPNQSHYTLSMNAVQVGDDDIKLPTTSLLDSLFGMSGGIGAIIDSGTTLAYLPDTIYNQLMDKISAAKPDIKMRTVENVFTCFDYSGNVDERFPVVKFKFDDSLSLSVYPHEYLFQISDDSWCIGWQSAVMQSKDGDDIALLGDLVLSNKLVVYDVENQSIGWVQYNCSSSIQVKDESSGAVYTVGAHDLSSASSSSVIISKRRLPVIFFSMITALLLQHQNLNLMLL